MAVQPEAERKDKMKDVREIKGGRERERGKQTEGKEEGVRRGRNKRQIKQYRDYRHTHTYI